MKKSGISREEIDDRFDKCLKKAMNDTQQLVKGEVSEDELGYFIFFSSLNQSLTFKFTSIH